MNFDFGQPTDGIFQTGFVVEDIDVAMQQFTERLGIGPWAVMRNISTEGTFYRGRPSEAVLNVAFGFSGHMAYELIQAVNDAPSAFRDVIESRGYGFHHFGRATTSFDADVEAMTAQGFDLVTSADFPGLRLAMFDTRDVLPGMSELIEANDSVDATFTGIWKASLGEREATAPAFPTPPPVAAQA
jgi:Glyoxalase/Bleomycin resistance protein/Dioxygenase superfamily